MYTLDFDDRILRLIGRALEKQAKENSLSQEKVSKLANISQASVSNLYNGKTHKDNLEIYMNLALAIGIKEKWFSEILEEAKRVVAKEILK